MSTVCRRQIPENAFNHFSHESEKLLTMRYPKGRYIYGAVKDDFKVCGYYHKYKMMYIINQQHRILVMSPMIATSIKATSHF